MSFMDVMYGPLGQVNNQFQANLGQNAAAMGQQQDFYGQQAALGGQNQALQNQIYGDFGKQTDYYSALGAAYGRQVPASSPAAVAAQGGGYGYGGLSAQDWATFSNAVGADAANEWAKSKGGGGIGSDAHYGDQPASFDDRFSAAPAQSSFADRWGTTSYTPQTQLPTMITGGAWGTGGSAPYAGGGGGYGGLSPQDYMQFAGIVGQEAAALWAQQQQKAAGLGGQPYGPGYFDNTFGSANAANQNSRDAIAAAWMAQNPYSGSGQMPSAVFGGRQAEDYWRSPFAGQGYSMGAGGIYQDPFGGYVPSTKVGADGLPGDYAPRYDAGTFSPIDNYVNAGG
jgi:hypothetical protein